MAAADATFEAPVGEDIGFGNFAGQDHGIVQRQRMAERAEAEIAGALRQGAEQRQGVRIDSELCEEGMLEGGEDIEAALVYTLGKGYHVGNELVVIPTLRACKF